MRLTKTYLLLFVLQYEYRYPYGTHLNFQITCLQIKHRTRTVLYCTSEYGTVLPYGIDGDPTAYRTVPHLESRTPLQVRGTRVDKGPLYQVVLFINPYSTVATTSTVLVRWAFSYRTRGLLIPTSPPSRPVTACQQLLAGSCCVETTAGSTSGSPLIAASVSSAQYARVRTFFKSLARVPDNHHHALHARVTPSSSQSQTDARLASKILKKT